MQCTPSLFTRFRQLKPGNWVPRDLSNQVAAARLFRALYFVDGADVTSRTSGPIYKLDISGSCCCLVAS
jgi:hypothetical protein